MFLEKNVLWFIITCVILIYYYTLLRSIFYF